MPKRSYRNYNDKEYKLKLDKVLNMIKSGKISRTRAAKEFNIPKGTIINKLKDQHGGKIGRPFVFSTEEEEAMLAHILKVSEWGYPFSRVDLQHLASEVLNRKGVKIAQFQDNLPTLKWCTKFIKRHKNLLSSRMCQNLKTSKAAVSPDALKIYFEALKVTLTENGDYIDPSRIFNYDETNLCDDPGTKKYIFKRGVKYPERIRDSTKSSVSVMFCGSAAGQIIPPYVVYKAEKIWLTWMEGGPAYTRYNRSKSGWFDATIFTDWFVNLFVPYIKKNINGRVVLLGDNLSSHFTEDVLKSAEKNNITFACFPKNSTHLCQPLDVAFYAPLKRKWRGILDTWKQAQKKTSQTIQKDQFPRLLKKLTDEIAPDNFSQNLISGFKKCGISPFNPEEVISRLPQANTEDGNTSTASDMVSGVVVDMLKSMRYGNENDTPKKRRCKVNVQAGASISVEDLLVNKTPPVVLPGCSNSKKKTPKKLRKKLAKKDNNIDELLHSDADIPYMDSSSEENWETYCEKLIDEETELWSDDEEPLVQLTSAFNSNEEKQTQPHNESELDTPYNKDSEIPIDTMECENNNEKINTDSVQVDDYLLVSFKTSSKCNTKKYYVGKVILNDSEVEVSFLRNKKLNFYWPNVVDQSIIESEQIVMKLKNPSNRKRGLFFEELLLNPLKIE